MSLDYPKTAHLSQFYIFVHAVWNNRYDNYRVRPIDTLPESGFDIEQLSTISALISNNSGLWTVKYTAIADLITICLYNRSGQECSSRSQLKFCFDSWFSFGTLGCWIENIRECYMLSMYTLFSSPMSPSVFLTLSSWTIKSFRSTTF